MFCIAAGNRIPENFPNKRGYVRRKFVKNELFTLCSQFGNAFAMGKNRGSIQEITRLLKKCNKILCKTEKL